MYLFERIFALIALTKAAIVTDLRSAAGKSQRWFVGVVEGRLRWSSEKTLRAAGDLAAWLNDKRS